LKCPKLLKSLKKHWSPALFFARKSSIFLDRNLSLIFVEIF
jgi:hypothetical protein